MTRQDAIDEIIATWLQRDGEFCCSRAERENSRIELHEVLTAIGVADHEMPHIIPAAEGR
jgi:hypothetical protein